MRIDVEGEATFVATAGPPLDHARRTVVLVHGAGMAPIVWAGQQTALADADTAVLAPALPGHGVPGSSRASAGPPRASIEGYAGWIIALLDRLKVERFILVGHSMGALVAFATALTSPHRVAGIAALGAAARMPVHPALIEAASQAPTRAVERILDWGLASPQSQRPPAIALVPLARHVLLASAPGVLGQDLAACNAYGALAERAAQIRCPVLVAVATRDRMTAPRGGRALAEALPNADLVTLAGVGHMAPVEAPTAVARELRAWLLRRADGGAAATGD